MAIVRSKAAACLTAINRHDGYSLLRQESLYIFNLYKYPFELGTTVRQEDRKKFVRLATNRVSNALKAVRLIGNLSNRSNYDYTEEDVQKIFRALQDELAACRKRFDLAVKRKNDARFTLE